jgi:hypothetical protein
VWCPFAFDDCDCALPVALFLCRKRTEGWGAQRFPPPLPPPPTAAISDAPHCNATHIFSASMLIDWNAACSSVEGRPISYSLNLVYAVGFSVVSAFMATSCTAAAMLFMHQRLDETMRAKIWSQFPHFLSSCCVGCIVGAAAWAARTQSIALEFQALQPYPPSAYQPQSSAPNSSSPACDLLFFSDYNSSSSLPNPNDLAHHISLKAQGELWNGVFLVLYPLEFLLLTLAKGAAALYPSPPSLTLLLAVLVLERLLQVPPRPPPPIRARAAPLTPCSSSRNPSPIIWKRSPSFIEHALFFCFLWCWATLPPPPACSPPQVRSSCHHLFLLRRAKPPPPSLSTANILPKRSSRSLRSQR